MSTEKESTASRSIERKLAAILSADVKGFSRLMGEDEEATLRALTASCQVTDSLILQHRGRVGGSAGDSILILRKARRGKLPVRVKVSTPIEFVAERGLLDA